MSRDSPRKHLATMVGMLALGGAILRFYRVDAQSFWNDEVLTVYNSSLTTTAALTRPRDINIMPLYYLVVHPILGWAPRELWLRLPSVLLGTLSIPLFYLVIRDWGGRALGLTAAALLALSPFHVWYSQEARPYALLMFLAIAAVRLLQLALRTGELWWKAAFVVVAALTFYCHTVALPLIAFFGATVLLTLPRGQWRQWLLPFTAIGILILPGLVRLVLIPPIGTANAYQPFSPWGVGYSLWAFGTGYSLGPTTADLHFEDRMGMLLKELPIVLPVGLVLGVMLVRGTLALRETNPALLRSALLWLTLPLAFAVTGSLMTVHPFTVRYAILSFPPFLLLLAAGAQSARPAWRVVALVLLGAVDLVALGHYYFDDRYRRDDNRAAGMYLSANAKTGDLVVATAAYTASNLRFYYHGPPLTIVPYPAGRHGLAAAAQASAPPVMGALYVAPDRLQPDLVAITSGCDRVWLFLSRTYDSDPQGLIRDFFEHRFRRRSDLAWSGAELMLYEPSSNDAAAGQPTSPVCGTAPP